MHVKEISFSYERMSTKTRFEEEATGNSEMAYSDSTNKLAHSTGLFHVNMYNEHGIFSRRLSASQLYQGHTEHSPVPEVFLDFSSFREEANKSRDSYFHLFAALSQLFRHAKKKPEKIKIKKNLWDLGTLYKVTWT